MNKLFLLLLVPLIATAGCGKQRPSELTFWHVMGGPLGKTLDAMAGDFQKETGIKVTMVNMGSYPALSQKLMASMAAGNTPALSQSYESWTSQLLEAKTKDNGVQPFADFLDAQDGLDSAARADFFPVMLAECARDGKFVSMPFNKSVPVYYYNRDLFRKAGLDPDRFPETWDEFLAAAKKLTIDRNRNGRLDPGDQWGTAMSKNAAWLFQCMLIQNRGQVFDENGKVVFDSPAGIEALQFLADLNNKHKVSYTVQGFDHQNDFLSGRVAMIQSSSASLSYMKQDSIKFDMGIAPLPRFKKRAVVLSGTNIVMFRNAAKGTQHNAWKYVKFMTGTRQTARWAAETNYLPVRKSALNEDILKEKFIKYYGLKDAYKQLEYAYPEPRETAWLTGRARLEEDGLQPAMEGVSTAAQSLRNAAAKINRQR
ncbi:MAG: ABC transporter substrate-binding protein [Candidatus Edwardsbacteria bacterium]|nr:ABC transporter substrate-binding protein [Candidatus Edwardsbacteria bacterium]